jgi:hypothetical protein
MGEKREAFRLLVGKPDGKKSLGRPRHRWEDNIGSFKRSFTTLKAYINLFRGHVQCLKCHDVGKHTEYYLG